METPASTYARFARFVRCRLAELGVREADQPDLCQEVFLVVHCKGHLLPAIGRVDLWLREICRRVAAGYRRRAEHRLEVFGCDPAERPDVGSDPPEDSDHGRKLALVRRALNHLDDESRDLLALHDVGQMPLGALAKLVAHDRKTVRGRLARARRRVSRWVSGGGAPGPSLRPGSAPRRTPPASPFMREQAARGRAAGCAARELEILRVSPEVCSGALANVAVSDLRGPEIGVATIEAAMAQAPYTLERCGGEIAYLALIEPTVRPPTLEVRQKLADALEIVGPYLKSFAAVLLGDNARINQPILEGLMLLVRPRFPTRFFSSTRAAAEWLCETEAGGPTTLSPAELIAAAEHLRQISPDPRGGSRRARAFPAVRA